jgi:hypothetical protein
MREKVRRIASALDVVADDLRFGAIQHNQESALRIFQRL